MPTAQEYKVAIDAVQQNIAGFTWVQKNIINESRDCRERYWFSNQNKTDQTFAAEVFQFHTGDFVTSDTEPIPAVCNKASNNKLTAGTAKFIRSI